MLRVVNRELYADFVPERYSHVAGFDPKEEWIEMRLRADERSWLASTDLGLTVAFG